MAIDSESNGRKIHGTSPTMELVFAGKGVLRSAHLERGVQIVSDEEAASEKGTVLAHRTWISPVADVAFRNAGKNKVELASIHGTGGVTVEALSQRGNAPATPKKMSADDVMGVFGAHGSLTTLTGRGHTTIAETTPTGTRADDQWRCAGGASKSAGEAAKQSRTWRRDADRIGNRGWECSVDTATAGESWRCPVGAAGDIQSRGL